MSIEDCEAICPKCGHHISFEITYGDGKTIISDLAFHCTGCNWREPWKRSGLFFTKQPPLKKIRKIFTIEYYEDTLFTVKEIREILNHAFINDPFVKVEEIDGYAIKNVEFDFNPEIVNNCENCGWVKDGYLCKNPKDCIEYSEWKPIEPEIEKYCGTCEIGFKNTCDYNKCRNGNYKDWIPKKEKTEKEENGKKEKTE